MNKKKQVALVTGASRGIGKAIAKELSKNGIQIIGTATNKNGVNIINKYLKKNGFGLILNLEKYGSITEDIKKIYQEYQIDILVNNAGTTKDKLLIKMTEKEWCDVIQINLNSIFYLTKYCIKSMIQKKYGRIVTIGSIIGYIGNKGQINYSTSKSGLIGFHKSLALEVASKGITVNIVSPGLIKTDLTKNFHTQQYQKYLSLIPMKKIGHPEDIAHAVMFLISEKASYITGQTLHVNGGMFMV
jgi:3-oxoacyl-[acyl-carrier protein] reductase